MTLLTVYGSGLLGSVGISSALFGILAKEGVNIHFISQSVAEYSISFAVKRPDTEQAKRALDALISNTFRSSFTDLSYTSVPVEIVSVFGQGMRHVPGISGRVYSALGAAGVNVVASSQGGEELSISVVVGEADAQKAKEALERL
jgi:aspartokinase/homoserine dehydrogenase 1